MSSQYHDKALYELPNAALQEKSILIRKIDNALRNILHPQHIYSGKYGHTPELAFHFIPVSQ